MLTPEQLRELVLYDAETGIVINRATGRVIGAPAGAGGRLQVVIAGQHLYVHRLAWAYVHGEWPAERMQVDHINGDKRDNRITNLRLATPKQNTHNKRTARVDNLSGLMGVGYDKRKQSQPWRARIMVDGKSKHLGFYDTPEEAHAAYLRAKTELHPFWVAAA